MTTPSCDKLSRDVPCVVCGRIFDTVPMTDEEATEPSVNMCSLSCMTAYFMRRMSEEAESQ